MIGRVGRIAVLAAAVAVGVQAPSQAMAMPANDTTGQGYGLWFEIPPKGGVRATASLVANDHDVNKAAGQIAIKNLDGKKAYVSYRPSGGRFGVGRAAWLSGPVIRSGAQYRYWWDYFYPPVLEPYAFEFRICLSKRGLDSCGSKLKIKEPPTRPF